MTHEVQNSDRRHIISVVLLWCGVAVFAVVIALVIGNVLGDTADDLPSDPSVPANIYKYTGADVPPVDAWHISLSGKTFGDIEASVNSLPSSVTAVSLYMRDADGVPTYSSDVYSAVTGKQIFGVSLKDVVGLLHAKGHYVSGCFDIRAPQIAGTDGCSALANFETELICEAFESGIDELILLGLPSGEDSIYIAAGIFENVRKKYPTAVIGAGIDYKLMLSDAGAEALLGYLNFADFCAIDTAGARAVGLNAVGIVKGLEYVFETYPIRLLFEFSSDSDRQSQSEALRQIGIINIQSHKTSTASSPSG